MDPEAYRQQRAYAGAGARGPTGGRGGWGGPQEGPGGVRFDVGDDIDLEDLLGGMFGSRGRTGWGPIPGADHETEVVVSLEEAYQGGQRSFTINGSDGPRTLVTA
jgi:curved DNA-binding protein